MTHTPHRRLVLVIDTDAGFTEDARHLLGDQRVLTARSIEEAVETVATEQVDLALLGPSFGNQSAILSAGLVREADPGVAAVLVADVVTNRVLLAALRSGLVDVVDTPLTGTKLAGILERVPEPRESGTVVLDDGPESIEANQARGFFAGIAASDPGADDVDHTGEALSEIDASSSLSSSVSYVEVEATPDEALDAIDPPAPAAPQPFADAWVVPIDALGQPTHREIPDADPGSAPRHRDDPDPAAPLQITEESSHPSPPVYAAPPPSGADTAFPPTIGSPPSTAVALGRIGEGPSGTEAQLHAPSAGRVVAVMAGKGGSGKTITATNLAMALAQQRGPGRVVLVDADLQFGDVALMLQLEPSPTVVDVIPRLDALTDGRLDEMLIRHESGLRVVAAPLHPVPAESLPVKGIVELIERLRATYDAIVVDTPPIFDDYLVSLLEASDEVLVVVDMDVSSVKNAKIALESLQAGGFPMERVRLVVNRANAKARLDLVEMERSLGLRVAGSIPSDRLIPQAVNEGVPVVALSPRSRAARSFHALADLIDLPEPRRSA